MTAQLFKSSINVKTLGNPRDAVAGQEIRDGDKIFMGTIFGKATGTVTRQNPKDPGNDFVGLRGAFEAQPPADDAPATGSSNLFAPDSIHEKVVAELKQGSTVMFAFEVYAVKGGTAGFTWLYNFMTQGEPIVEDQLASVRALVRKVEVPADTNVKQIGRGKKE